jgi:putative Holliday junction resolvase
LHAYNGSEALASENCTPGRILALDVGARRIGMALSDELMLTAQGIETLERTNLREDLTRLTRLATERGVNLILIGNPMNLSGSEGRQSAWVRDFGHKLQAHSGIQVRFYDERLTTKEAERVLRQSGISRVKRGRAVDRLSAVILLSSYLESQTAAPVGDSLE